MLEIHIVNPIIYLDEKCARKLQHANFGLLVFLYFIGCIARFLFGQINCEAKKIFVSKSAAVGSGTYVVKKGK